jgi:HEAT repeat protein
LADEDWQVMRSATYALGNIGDEQALALLERAMSVDTSAMRNLEVECAAEALTMALVRIGGEKAVAQLENVLSNQDLWVRIYATQALGQIGGEKAVALLEKTLADEEPLELISKSLSRQSSPADQGRREQHERQVNGGMSIISGA